MNTQLLGISIDNHYSHITWIRNIKEKFGVENQFPIIAALKMGVAKASLMFYPGAADTSAVRATFIIDPQRIMRAMVYYPMSNGRSIDEIFRRVIALKTSDSNKMATPESSHFGDKVIVHPPVTTEAAEARVNEGYEFTDWHFCKIIA